jgi:uncharacterized damage-inducible protein DinB
MKGESISLRERSLRSSFGSDVESSCAGVSWTIRIPKPFVFSAGIDLRQQRYHPFVLTLLQSLFSHQAWADAAILSAVQSHPESLRDEWLLKTLHHVVVVQRVFLFRFLGRPFDSVKESQPPESFDKLVDLFRATHDEQLAFVNGVSESDLERRFELPFLKAQPTIVEGLTQIVMHSQNHRGQCLTRLRENGAKPPTLDYILWIKDRPAPSWLNSRSSI